MKSLKSSVGALALTVTLSSSALAGNIGLPRASAATGNIGLPRASATGNIGLPRNGVTGNTGRPRTIGTANSSYDSELLNSENIGLLIRFLLQMGPIF